MLWKSRGIGANSRNASTEIHDITPTTIVKGVSLKEGTIKGIKHLAKTDIKRQMIELDAQMREAAETIEL